MVPSPLTAVVPLLGPLTTVGGPMASPSGSLSLARTSTVTSVSSSVVAVSSTASGGRFTTLIVTVAMAQF